MIKSRIAMFAGLTATAATLVVGGTTAAFAGTHPTATPTVTSTSTPAPTPTACTVTRGSSRLTLVDNGTSFSYRVRLHLTPTRPFYRGITLITGTLCDTHEPTPLVLNVRGVLFGGDVAVFSVRYPSTGPDAGPQGVRTFSGLVGPRGHTAGNWSETGAEGGAGTFTLGRI